jgi:hypothetical protein
MQDLINKDLNKYFTDAEITTIKKFVSWLASTNQAEQSRFSEQETDDEIKAGVLDWLERRHSQGLRPRNKR